MNCDMVLESNVLAGVKVSIGSSRINFVDTETYLQPNDTVHRLCEKKKGSQSGCIYRKELCQSLRRIR